MPKYGLGITTYNRPDRLAETIASVDEHLDGQFDVKLVVDDHSDEVPTVPEGWGLYRAEENAGVANSRNIIVSTLMNENCDYLVLMEDDVVVISPDALKRYCETLDKTTTEVLMFAHHGGANGFKPVVRSAGIEAWPNCVGAWIVYTRKAIETVGNFNPNYRNALDHVEHAYRLSLMGMCGPWGVWPDVEGSRELLAEQPGALESSVIGRDIMDPEGDFQRSLRIWHDSIVPFPQHLMTLMVGY